MNPPNPKRPRYWYCILGPIPNDKVDPMGDGPPRAAVRGAALRMTGVDAQCSSSWVEEGDVDAMRDALSKAYESRWAT